MARELDDEEIISLVEGEINGSAEYLDSEVGSQQARAMEYFYGEPFGNEEDGRSQVVITDVQDTIMWMMPSLMRIFTAGDSVVRFVQRGQRTKSQQNKPPDMSTMYSTSRTMDSWCYTICS